MCVGDFTPILPTATDACGTVDSITTPAGAIYSATAPTILTYTATDNSGNSSTCSYTVTVIPNIPPQVTDCPSSPINVDADTLCQGIAFWTAPTFEAACGLTLDTITNDYQSGGLFSFGPTLVNYTATDIHGNVSTCSFEVVVRDVTPPSLICPNDTIITPVSGCSVVVNYTLGAIDNCDADLTFICSDTSGAVFTGITPVICAVLDDAGNVANCAFVVTIADTIAPMFPNGCPPNINVVLAFGNCGANPTWVALAVSDNCVQNLVPMASQASGTFFDVQGSPHSVMYTATDALGNTSVCTFTVTVADSTKPVLQNCQALPIVKFLVDSCTVNLTWSVPTASDNCTGVTLTSNLNPGIFPTGDTVVVYTATDASGNVTTCFFSVSVKDVVPPVIDCPIAQLPVPVPSPCGVVPVWTLPTATDNCTLPADLIITSSYMPGDTFPEGTTTFVVSVEDASGLTDECQITVINDVTQEFTNVPGPILVAMCSTLVTWNSPIPLGFCPPVTVDSSHTPGTIFPFGTTIVTYEATDTFGNSATATFLVIVSENIAPVIDCPVSPIVVNVGGGVVSDPNPTPFLLTKDTVAGCTSVELTFNLPNATDNCVTPTVTLMPPFASGMPFPLGVNELKFEAVDSSGNRTQCLVFLHVVALDTLDPIVNPTPACTGDEVVITASNIAGATYTWTGPVTSTTNVVTIGSLSVQNSGQYIVTANVNGCNTAPDTAIVFLTSAPSAENDLNYTINPGETIDFSSVLINDDLSPAFDFEICNSSALEGLVMNTNDGTFTYTAGDEPGMVSFFYVVCSKTCELEDQAAVTITINDTKCVFIPNIITPNGDNTNDWFTIPCIETGLFRENSLQVYNQWGDQVYEASPYSNDEADAWHGTLNGELGKDLPDGVYFFIFKPGPNIAPMKGFVEIFR